MHNRLFRSLLFVPASRLDMAARAHERGADAVIIDLEDGVVDTERPAARATLSSLLRDLHAQGAEVLLRINSLAADGALDIAAIEAPLSPPLLVPKVAEPETIADVEACWTAADKELSNLQILPMIECPKGMFNAAAIAGVSPRVSALVFGSEDFATAAGISTGIDGLSMPAQWVALAAAAAGIPAYGLPGSLANYHDLNLFTTTLQKAKGIGFTGSLCVHPGQVSIANQVFQPSEQEIQWALAVQDQAGDGGATGGDIGMVDAPIAARARAILAKSGRELI